MLGWYKSETTNTVYVWLGGSYPYLVDLVIQKI